MSVIPKTSVTLLNAISASPDSTRWYDFYNRYKPVIATLLKSGAFKDYIHSSDVDEIIQRTMIAFMEKAPNYHYDPDTNGAFHSYIITIAKNKAREFMRNRGRETKKRNIFKAAFDLLPKTWKRTSKGDQLKRIAKRAVCKVLNDESISIRDREIFRRTTNGEPPESVAEAFGITRNNVDQIKARIMRKVRATAEKLNRAELTA